MNKELTITKENALAAFKNGGKKEKELLINLFGEDVFKFDPIKDINSFEDVLRFNEADPEIFKDKCEGLTSDEIAYRKLKLIAKAYNNGWTPNWDDGSEYKYYPWFVWNSSASGFSCLDYACDDSDSDLGSRLVFQNIDHAIDAGKKFKSIYNQFLKP